MYEAYQTHVHAAMHEHEQYRYRLCLWVVATAHAPDDTYIAVWAGPIAGRRTCYRAYVLAAASASQRSQPTDTGRRAYV